MREIVTVHTGQCGNQIGARLWQMLLAEHASAGPIYDSAASCMFANLDSKTGAVLAANDPVSALKARAVLVDMETGVINQTLRSPIGPLFDSTQTVTDVSGSGNNWAHGYVEYGRLYSEAISDLVRTQLELCDSCGAIMCVNSIGGGTGSGLGSRILENLADEFPGITQIVTAVVPAGADDVVTSPYNALLSLAAFREAADIVIPVDNLALARLASGTHTRLPFDAMNGVVGKMWVDLTAPVRQGRNADLELNLHRLASDLVPYPHCNYLIPSITPVPGTPVSKDVRVQSRTFDQHFTDVAKGGCQLLSVEIRTRTSIASGYIARVTERDSVWDVYRNVERIRKLARRPAWLQNHNVIAVAKSNKSSVLHLDNSTGVDQLFVHTESSFRRLYTRRAHLHHYTEFIETDALECASHAVRDLIGDYGEARLVKPAGVPDVSVGQQLLIVKEMWTQAMGPGEPFPVLLR